MDPDAAPTDLHAPPAESHAAPAADSTWSRFSRYLQAPPHLTLKWHDPPTGARGWLVLNSLRGGAAGGGTRLRAGLERDEVIHLAKGMELKFFYSGPQIGGGKSGIDFDPADPRKGQVLDRWFAAIRPLLLEVYGTGGDVNVDEQRDVLPRCQALGLAHPQHGIVKGHLDPSGASLDRVDASLREGLGRVVDDPELGVAGLDLTLADLVTGYGVARAAARIVAGADAGRPRPLEGLRVSVEGFGAVGGPAALYLARLGARVVGLSDADSILVSPDGLGADEVEALIRSRRVREIPPHPLRRTGPERSDFYRIPAELFVPAAVSGTLTPERVAQLGEAGVTTLVCGANQPFREAGLGETGNQQGVDGEFTVVADVVGSLGMARAFHHLMAQGPVEDSRAVFDAVRGTMEDAVDAVVARRGGSGPGLLAAALAHALDGIGFST